jgi:mannosyltransferase OCH1-like enzyme
MELLKSIDIFLDNKAFFGFESIGIVSTSIMGCEKNHPFFRYLLEDYDKRVFIKEDRTFDYTTITAMITRCCLSLGLVIDNRKQVIENLTIYPCDYFCPKNWETKKVTFTENTCAIHHFEASWVPVSQKIRDAVGRHFPLLVSIKKKILPAKSGKI